MDQKISDRVKSRADALMAKALGVNFGGLSGGYAPAVYAA